MSQASNAACRQQMLAPQVRSGADNRINGAGPDRLQREAGPHGRLLTATVARRVGLGRFPLQRRAAANGSLPGVKVQQSAATGQRTDSGSRRSLRIRQVVQCVGLQRLSQNTALDVPPTPRTDRLGAEAVGAADAVDDLNAVRRGVGGDRCSQVGRGRPPGKPS